MKNRVERLSNINRFTCLFTKRKTCFFVVSNTTTIMFLFPIPIAFPNERITENITLLAIDIGATKTDIARFKTVL